MKLSTIKVNDKGILIINITEELTQEVIGLWKDGERDGVITKPNNN